MQRSWFNNRLTSAKQKSLLYKSLADLVQSMMDTFVDPWLERITNRKSIFSMSKEDLETRTNELGQFFTIRTSNSSSVPMLLQQRFDEIHFKGTERPINQTIYREFNGISVLWDPIYAPVDFERHPYGTVLIPESTLETTGGTFGEMFLTSRGMISIPINDLARTMGITGTIDQSAITEEILRKFNQFVKPLLPLHIVFD
ncbi:phage tail protein, partial [Escherichia coli]|nr:phage tail protein [Escherichia coli]